MSDGCSDAARGYDYYMFKRKKKKMNQPTCLCCGFSGTREEVIKHIKTCEEHPLAQLRERINLSINRCADSECNDILRELLENEL